MNALKMMGCATIALAACAMGLGCSNTETTPQTPSETQVGPSGTGETTQTPSENGDKPDGENAGKPDTENAGQATGDNAGNDGSAAKPDDAKGKTLVAFYSASGRTKRVAGFIANATQGVTFELVPTPNYTDDDLNYNKSDSRVSREHDDADLRDIALEKTTPDDWASYTTVYIGYPIWWGIAAWPVDNFVRKNDFTGKRVIPFATSYSSPFSNSGNLLKAMTTTGTWIEGKRFPESPSESDVAAWVKSIGD